jgi:hypothetical protein
MSCRGPVPWVPRAARYGLKYLDMTQLPTVANGWEAMHHVLDMVLPLLTEGDGPPT